MMIKSYLVAAIRHYSREKAYTLINVVGLALGLAVFVVSIQASYVGFHYDEFHANADRLYGVVQVRPTGQEGDKPMALVPGPLAPVMKSEFPSAGRIFLKIMRESVLLVVLANLVTLPLAYVLLGNMMQTGYAFSRAIDLSGFLLVAVFSILGVGLAILNLVVAAARQNPVHSLRYE